MALADEDHKWLAEQFGNIYKKIDSSTASMHQDMIERDMQTRARVSKLEDCDKANNRRITTIEAKAEVTGALAGKKEGVKWSVILGLALNLAVYLLKYLSGG